MSLGKNHRIWLTMLSQVVYMSSSFGCWLLDHMIYLKLRKKQLPTKLSKFTKWQLFSPKWCQAVISFLKLGLSEKHTKFEKIFFMVLTSQLIYLVNLKTTRKIFPFMCSSHKVRTLLPGFRGLPTVLLNSSKRRKDELHLSETSETHKRSFAIKRSQ